MRQSSQQQSSTSTPSKPLYSDPLSLAFLDMFGAPATYSKKQGGYNIGSGAPGSGGGLGYANQMFDSSTFDALQDQLAPVEGLGLYGAQGEIGFRQAMNIFDDVLSGLQDSTIPMARNIAETGLPTDMSPIIAQQMDMFMNQMIPEAANQFSFLGGGGQAQSSDFGAAISRAGGGIATNLGAMQAEMDESAAGRRLEGTALTGSLEEMLAGLGQQRAAFPLAMREQLFDQTLLERPGGQLLNFINNLVGTFNTDPILQANVTEGSGTGSTLGVLG